MTLKLKSTHPWHVHVENKAGRVLQTTETQEFFSRSEELHRKAGRFDQSSHCLSDRSIVVYHRDHSSLGQLATHCSITKVAPGLRDIYYALV